MKNQLVIALLFLATFHATAQCNEFYQFAKGSEWEYESSNAKGKVTSKNHQKVVSLDKTSTGFTAVVNSIIYDAKGKESMKGDLTYKCENNVMIIDMRNFVTEEQLQAFKGYEMKVESENLEMPSTLSTGQTLKDGSMTVTGEGGPLPLSLHLKITNRKVVGKESITTASGNYECYKITSNYEMQTQMGIKMNMNFSVVEWIAPKVGMVKSDTFNKSGKLMGTTVLTIWK